MKNVMEYKGYYGSINYNDEDKCFYGKVIGLKNSCILFEGTSVSKLRKDFEEMIDLYLEDCREHNEKPEIQCKGSLNVRIGPELHIKAKIRAESENISINELIKEALAKYLEA